MSEKLTTLVRPTCSILCGCLLASMVCSSPALGEEWTTTKWRVICQVPRDCAPANEVYEVALEEGSKWLSGLGFKEPTLGTVIEDDVRWVATIDDTKEPEKIFGVYYPTSNELYLRSDRFFAMGEAGQSFDDPRFRVEMSNMFTPVHEVFHAVQGSYEIEVGYNTDSGHDWIFEGGAEAVLRSYADTYAPGLNVVLRPRFFDFPLHEPPQKADTYGTWSFWLKLGKLVNSPGRIAYMTEILSEDLSAHNGLEGVDKALQPFGGFYELVPKVFATAPKQFLPRPLVKVTIDHDQSVSQETIAATVKKVAGRKTNILLEEHSAHVVIAEVRIKEVDPDLHLIVDKKLYNEGEGSERNVYQTIMDEDTKELEVIVANVAAKAIDSKSKNVTLQVRLIEMKPCDPTVMMDAMDEAAPVRKADIYMAEFAPGGNRSVQNLLMPSISVLNIAEFTSGQVACTDPIGTNPMKSANSKMAVIAAAGNEAAAIRDYAQRIQQLNPSGERSDEDRNRHNNASQIKELTDATVEAQGAGSDALIQIYSPNAMTWQTGTLPDPLIFNGSAANVVFRIVGVAPEDLEVGRTYSAVSVEASPHGIASGDEPTPYNTLYTSWAGNKKRLGIPDELAAQAPAGVMEMFNELGFTEMAEKAFVFEGTMQQVYTKSPLTGTVKITAVNAGLVIGQFNLGGGSVGLRKTTKKYRKDRNGRINGDRIVGQDDSFIALSVSGTFMAPAVERVYRPNRPISYTARVRESNN